MASTSREAKIEVTIDGNGFETPSEMSYRDVGEIPLCDLVFPSGTHSRYRILKSDIIRVYAGLDEVPDFPTFTGHLDDEQGIWNGQMKCVGSLNRAVDDPMIVDDYNNYDGLEIGNAIESIFNDVSELSWMTGHFEATSPVVTVPEGLRFLKGKGKYDVMKQFKTLAVDPTVTADISQYTLFQHGDDIHFRKSPGPATAEPSVILAYGDNLLNFNPESQSKNGYNRARVVGLDGATGIYENAHRLAVDCLKEMPMLFDDTIPNGEEAYQIARANVLSSIFTKSGMTIQSHELIEMVPNFSVIEITGAPHGFSDKYLIKTKSISINEANFNVTCKVSTPIDIFSELLSQLIN
ncbi:MAG: hypothetical protein ACTSVR_04865 [Candidatus Thorarchaeota archaeon]